MLQTIEIEIDSSGHIHPLEPLSFRPAGRVLLILLEPPHNSSSPRGSAEMALALLASPRFTNRPEASPDEVRQRIAALRNEWDGHS
jgi:hypothetical protein